MFRQWALAKKLCHFMLMYEPNNNEAKQYAPLIDYMLAKEQASSSSSSDDDSTGKSTKNYIQYVLIIYLDDENDSRRRKTEWSCRCTSTRASQCLFLTQMHTSQIITNLRPIFLSK
jgi:hypothetical protein